MEGLPDGIPFRKPCDYGAKQIREIMNAKDEIKFIIIDETPTDEIQMEVATTEEEIGFVGQARLKLKAQQTFFVIKSILGISIMHMHHSRI